MQLRGLSVAFFSSIVAGGAYYAYTGDGSRHPFNTRDVVTDSPGQQVKTSVGPSKESIGAHGQADPTLASQDARSNRRTLVVDNESFYESTLADDEAVCKTTDDAGRKRLELMTPEQATEKLRKNEESFLVGRGKGVVRYDVVQLSSNDPIEDDHAEKVVEVSPVVAPPQEGHAATDWMFWGVFDGHSGWTTSARLRQALIPFVARELNETHRKAMQNPSSPMPEPSTIDAALRSAFVQLDNEICIESVRKLLQNPSRRLGAELLAPAMSGSCALLSFYDTRSKIFRVACTGDSRAVLGRRNATSGKWMATQLSEDQTGSNPKEAARMRAEHPGEPDVVRNGRVLGNLEPSRAFGDAFYKWGRDIQDKINRQFFGRAPHQNLKTPPYVTAEPVVTSTQIDPSQGDFVVLATDGLWEMLTNEEVVGLVGQWMEENNASGKRSGNKSWFSSWFNSENTSLPVESGGNSGKDGRANGKPEAPIRQRQWQLNSQNQSRFIVEDKNAATHLVRNALGGRDRDMVCALLTLPSPYSRRYR